MQVSILVGGAIEHERHTQPEAQMVASCFLSSEKFGKTVLSRMAIFTMHSARNIGHQSRPPRPSTAATVLAHLL